MDTTQQQIVILGHDDLVAGDIVRGNDPPWRSEKWYEVRVKHETYIRIGLINHPGHMYSTHYTNHPRAPGMEYMNQFQVTSWAVKREGVEKYSPSQVGDRDDDV